MRSIFVRAACRCSRTSAIRSRKASRCTTSPSRMCRPASAPAICSVSPTFTTRRCVGTSDLCELALGWCTYGVGDHMAHYHVNASVPKTLIQYLIRWVARTEPARADSVSEVLLDVLDTPISPELVPGKSGLEPGAEHRSGSRPLRAAGFPSVLRSALRLSAHEGRVHGVCAWRDRNTGNWPEFPRPRAISTPSPRSSTGWAFSPKRFFQLSSTSAAHPECAESRFRRIAIAAQRLSSAER